MNQDDKNNEEIDLSGALKDSGTGVKSQEQRVGRTFFPGTPKVIQWTIKYSGGLVKNEKQASYVLIGFVAVTIIVALVLILSGSGKQEIFTPEAEAPPAEVIPPAEF